MSWSQSFSLDRSPVEAAYHRVAITLTVDEVLSVSEDNWKTKFLEYKRLFLMHVNLIRVDSLKHAIQALGILSRVSNEISEGKSFPMFLTVTCPMDRCEKLLESQLRMDLLMIDLPSGYVSGKRDEGTQLLLNRLALHESVRYLGACGFESVNNLDVFMQCHQGTPKLQFMGLTIVDLPNIQNMAIELIHSFRMNCLAYISDNIVHNVGAIDIYSSLASKYSISPMSFLMKCMLQIGAVISLPLEKLRTTQPDIVVEMGRLGHPFVHRKEFVSAFKIVSLQIEDDDMDAVLAASDDVEIARDKENISLAITVPEPLSLSY